MIKSELLIRIKKLGVPPYYYSVDDGRLVYGTNLRRNADGNWVVYRLTERGDHFQQKLFASEDEANDYFFELVQETASLMSEESKKKFRE